MPRGTQVKRDGLAITVERRGTSSGIALRHLSRPQLHVWSAKDHTGRETAPRGVGFQVGLSRQSGLKVPTQAPVLITPEEPWVLIAVGGPIRQFPFRYWGHLLRAYWSPWPTFLPIRSVMGTVWTSQNVLLQCSCPLWLGLGAIFTRVSNCASLPHPFWGGIYWARSMPLFPWI